MKRAIFLFATVWLVVLGARVDSANAQAGVFDIRGSWSGNAKGSIFGATGSVTINQQNGEDFSGMVEGGNVFGTARFSIQGKVKGNYIFGEKDGHTFQGFLYADGTIRGMFRASDGDRYRVFLQRPYSYWGMPPNGGMWYGSPAN